MAFWDTPFRRSVLDVTKEITNVVRSDFNAILGDHRPPLDLTLARHGLEGFDPRLYLMILSLFI